MLSGDVAENDIAAARSLSNQPTNASTITVLLQRSRQRIDRASLTVKAIRSSRPKQQSALSQWHYCPGLVFSVLTTLLGLLLYYYYY